MRHKIAMLLAIAATFAVTAVAGPAHALPCPIPDVTIGDEEGEIRPAVQPREEC